MDFKQTLVEKYRRILFSYPDILIGSFILTILYLLLFFNDKNNLLTSDRIDEINYVKVVMGWEKFGLPYVYETLKDTKPLPFLYLIKFFNADVIYTRSLNVVLVLANTYLLYSISKNKLSLFFPVIIVFLNSMWLTVEIIEVFFMLLGFRYFVNHKGIMVGLACLVRPYAFIYVIFQNKINILYTLIIGGLCGIFLMIHGVFFIYFDRMINYAGVSYVMLDYPAFIMMIPLMFAGMVNMKYFKYGVAGMVGLFVSMNAHYFIPAYTFLFLAYLTIDKEID